MNTMLIYKKCSAFLLVTLFTLMFGGRASVPSDKETALTQKLDGRLDTFKTIEMSKIQTTEDTDGVDEEDFGTLETQPENKMRQVFPDLAVVDNPHNFSGQAELEITPILKRFRLIGGVTRFFAGAMAGQSGIH